jgi:Domain of unknown function (DUF309)
MNPSHQDTELGRKAPPSRFDPFADRAARDIRNRLSTAFVRALEDDDPGPFEQAAQKCLAYQPVEIYHGYILDRLDRYRKAFRQLKRSGAKERTDQVTALWNHGLFFEVHELLEALWQESSEPLKQALKGLIQAAGVYIHLERGHVQAAQGLARRALVHLSQAGGALTFLADVTPLREKLGRLDPQPPRLSPPRKRSK